MTINNIIISLRTVKIINFAQRLVNVSCRVAYYTFHFFCLSDHDRKCTHIVKMQLLQIHLVLRQSKFHQAVIKKYG